IVYAADIQIVGAVNLNAMNRCLMPWGRGDAIKVGPIALRISLLYPVPLRHVEVGGVVHRQTLGIDYLADTDVIGVCGDHRPVALRILLLYAIGTPPIRDIKTSSAVCR